MNEWIIGKIIKINYWTKNLFSLILHASIDNFIAGQFAKLSIKVNGRKIQRAYSYVNAPKNKNLEFYISKIVQGKLSPLLFKLSINDELMISKKSYGFFILKNIPLYCKDLWMLSTGTAIGPFLSMIEQGEDIKRFKNIVLVHAVSFLKDLNYFNKMIELKNKYNNILKIQTIISREKIKNSLHGRIPLLISNGKLEKSIGLEINPLKSHIMLCGNPNMVSDTQKILKKYKNMNKNLKKKPGHITSENYW
ncbi:FAD-binding oxidoreductase [Sodalis-like secondary symbiont of Drepanosiphum platanoidis]|uniref:FAD-binding oxidoreductase n=1 Tax=Sodalis-like secondary symbiont of Drepanosiphum platanoidis TaxID=2994493 RepID=UPI0034646915